MNDQPERVVLIQGESRRPSAGMMVGMMAALAGSLGGIGGGGPDYTPISPTRRRRYHGATLGEGLRGFACLSQEVRQASAGKSSKAKHRRRMTAKMWKDNAEHEGRQ